MSIYITHWKKLFFNIFNDDDFSLPKAKDKIFVVLVFLLVQFWLIISNKINILGKNSSLHELNLHEYQVSQLNYASQLKILLENIIKQFGGPDSYSLWIMLWKKFIQLKIKINLYEWRFEALEWWKAEAMFWINWKTILMKI